MEHTLHGFAARRNLASSGKSWLRRLSSDTGFRASCAATNKVRLIQIDGVERPRYRQHLSARTWSLQATPQGREPFREAG